MEVTAPAQAFRSESRPRKLEKLMSDNWTEVILRTDVGLQQLETVCVDDKFQILATILVTILVTVFTLKKSLT